MYLKETTARAGSAIDDADAVTRSRDGDLDAYAVLVAIFFAVDAEGKSLEDIAKPLSVIGKPSEAIFRSGGRSGGPGDQGIRLHRSALITA